MITTTNIDTSEVLASNGEPVVTIMIEGKDLMLLHKSVMITGTMLSNLHDRLCDGQENPVVDSLHNAMDELADLLDSLTDVIEETDEASPECPGCGEKHFHQATDVAPTRMSDEALAEVIDMFAKQVKDEEEE